MKILNLSYIRFLISKNNFRLRFFSRSIYIIHKYLSKIFFTFTSSFSNHIYKKVSIINSENLPKNILKKFFQENEHDVIIKNYLNHEFDLLGSGWCKCNKNVPKKNHNFISKSLRKRNFINFREYYLSNLNSANRYKSFKILSLISKSYKFIDWHIDIKSSFRWPESKWYREINYGNKIGTDVKLPWELSRLQHLPQLALYLNNLDCQSPKAKIIEEEILNQILDFIAFNPPLYGVNWTCSMEVAIRSVNILITIYLMPNSKKSICAEKSNIIINSLYDHAKYILKNLEWSKNRGNHYLANLCGLLCLSSLLSETSESNKWLAFTFAELNREISHQFNFDGSNFEGSTGYHFLTLEMILFTIIISLNIEESRLIRISKLKPSKYSFLPFYANPPLRNKLYQNLNSNGKKIYSLLSNNSLQTISKACLFLEDCSDYVGKHPQIGDNDSGRFLNLRPNWKKLKSKEAKILFKVPKKFTNSSYYFFQDSLITNNVIELAESVGIVSLKKNSKNSFHYEFGKYLAKNKTFDILRPKNFFSVNDSGDISNLEILKEEIFLNKKINLLKREIKLSQNLFDSKLVYKYYSDFGLHIWKNSFFFISIRSIQKQSPFIKSHFHDDQLSITFKLEDKYIFKDYGSYVYTSFPKIRNLYRSRKIHFPTSYEPNTEKKAFENLDIKSVKCFYSGKKGFSGIYLSRYSIDKIVMELHENKVDILMGSIPRFNEETFSKRDSKLDKFYYSPGYGILEN